MTAASAKKSQPQVQVAILQKSLNNIANSDPAKSAPFRLVNADRYQTRKLDKLALSRQ